MGTNHEPRTKDKGPRTKDQGQGTKGVRLLAIDLDGTLLDSRSEISQANRQAVAEASARGVKVAFAGRPDVHLYFDKGNG